MNEYGITIGELTVSLPLVKVSDELSIYSFNMMGKASWNREAAKAISRGISLNGPHDFHAVVTAESKAIALTEQLAELFAMDRYVVLRKSVKAYMENPIKVETQSITTAGVQHLYIDRTDAEYIKDRKVLVVDDVVSTGGTLDAIFKIAEKANFKIARIACVLTEGVKRTEYNGVPLVSIDHIPIP
jgi:adenine phosphoribosyltransferase